MSVKSEADKISELLAFADSGNMEVGADIDIDTMKTGARDNDDGSKQDGFRDNDGDTKNAIEVLPVYWNNDRKKDVLRRIEISPNFNRLLPIPDHWSSQDCTLLGMDVRWLAGKRFILLSERNLRADFKRRRTR